MPEISSPSTATDYRRFDLTGDHYACGYAMGRSTALRVIPGWRGRPVDEAFARDCAEVVREQHAPLVDEYRGYADGQDRDWVEVLPHFSLGHDAGAAGGCSTLLWRAADGTVMAARNYDFMTSQRARHLIRSAPAGVHAILGTNASLIGGALRWGECGRPLRGLAPGAHDAGRADSTGAFPSTWRHAFCWRRAPRRGRRWSGCSPCH